MKVVVIGAGIVGVSAALTLAEEGVDSGIEVVVLERGSVAGEASGVNAGVISGGGWGHQPDVEVALKMGSRDRYIDLVERRGHDIDLDRTGTLTLIRTPEQWAWAEATVAADRQAGRRLELVGSTDLVGLEPAVDPTLLGAVLDPLGARAEPVAATLAFAAEAVAAGVSLETGCTVDALRPVGGGGWEVGYRQGAPTEAKLLGADAVVLAAGAWCAELGTLVGVEVPIVAVRGQMWASVAQPPLLRHAIAAAESLLAWSPRANPGPRSGSNQDPPDLTHRGDQRLTRHLYGRQRPNGEIVFGGDRVRTTDRTVDPDGIAANHAHVGELLPAVRALPPDRTWSGLMPFSLDGRPLLGPVPGHDGLFLAGGLASSGFGRGPMTGQLVAELVLGHQPDIDLTPVDPHHRVTPR